MGFHVELVHSIEDLAKSVLQDAPCAFQCKLLCLNTWIAHGEIQNKERIVFTIVEESIVFSNAGKLRSEALTEILSYRSAITLLWYQLSLTE